MDDSLVDWVIALNRFLSFFSLLNNGSYKLGMYFSLSLPPPPLSFFGYGQNDFAIFVFVCLPQITHHLVN
jgi:hypothetical protein